MSSDVRADLNPEGTRILVYVRRFYAGFNDEAKKIRGYRWEPELTGKPWSYPVNMATCYSLRETWPKLQIGPSLWDWATAQKQELRKRREIIAKPDSDLPLLRESHPEFFRAMDARPYQRSGSAFLARTRVAGNLDEPGLGKTAEALAAVIEAGLWEGSHLIICPKTAIWSTWGYEINKWTPDAEVFCMPDGRPAREKTINRFLDSAAKTKFLVVHPYMLQIKIGQWCTKCKIWLDDPKVDIPGEHYGENHKSKSTGPRDKKVEWPELYEVKWDSVIADECDEYLLKLRHVSAKNQPQWAHGMRRIQKVMREDGMRIPMTGTPFRGRESNIFGILHWMDPKTNGSFWKWADQFFEVEEEEHRVRGGGQDRHKIIGALREDRRHIFFETLDTQFLRRTRNEVRADLPAIQPVEKWVELEGEHLRQYEEFANKGEVSLESGVLEGMGILSEMTRMRQLSFGVWDIRYRDNQDGFYITPDVRKSPKVQLMCDMLRERGIIGENIAGNNKVIIVSQFTQILLALEKLFQGDGIATLAIHGKVVGKARTAAQHSFQNDPDGPRILLLHTKTGGKSLTLDKYCDEMFILDETWVHDDQVQVMGRINNRGEEIRPRFYYFLRTKNTVEERIATRNDNQADMQATLLDRRRGKDFAVSLLRKASDA